jgi:hypothetical protein
MNSTLVKLGLFITDAAYQFLLWTYLQTCTGTWLADQNPHGFSVMTGQLRSFGSWVGIHKSQGGIGKPHPHSRAFLPGSLSTVALYPVLFLIQQIVNNFKLLIF